MANEDLRSANEDLNTVNVQLSNEVEELNRRSADLKNLFGGPKLRLCS